MTDVGGNARGMLVGDRMNPWQQNNEHKQYADKQCRLCAGWDLFMFVFVSCAVCGHVSD